MSKSHGKHAKTAKKTTEIEEQKSAESGESNARGDGDQSALDSQATKMIDPIKLEAGEASDGLGEEGAGADPNATQALKPQFALGGAADEKPSANEGRAKDASRSKGAGDKESHEDADGADSADDTEEDAAKSKPSESDDTVMIPALPKIESSDFALRDREGGASYPPAYESMAAGSQPAFVSAGFGDMALRKRRSGLKAFAITVGVIAAVLLAAYLAGAIVFMGRFLPGTSIADKDVSLKPDAEVAEMLTKLVDSYQLDVVGNGFSYRMGSADIGASVDTDRVLAGMHADQDAWKWPLLILQPSHDETNQLVVTYKQDAYEPGLTAEVEKYNETAKDPVNASIMFDANANKFVVKPEEAGTKLDTAAVLAATAKAIDALEPKMAIGEEQIIQPTMRATDEKIISAAELASGMVSAHLALFMGGQLVSEVTGAMLSEFVTVDDKFEVTFREEELNAWVDNLASGFNTVGTERVYTRADGKQIAVSGGVYGWEVDTAALKDAVLEGIRAGKPAEIGVPCTGTAAVYNGPNQPDWGARYIDVDLSEQYVRFYGDDGSIIWEAACITGMPDGEHNTGEGVWSVNGKESPSKLIGYENGRKIYETMVTYWMPFEGNGIGFHDATWQPSFGGSMYANGYGSHGCVNLSYSDAQSLYGIIQAGDVVIVHS